jgi:myo-inositol-1(or 4)-monophosphatase
MYSPVVEKALGIALAAHDGQLRKASSEPYIVHPLHVALILARWGQDDDVIVAGLLHDVVEDCDGWDLARVEREFGHHIAHVVGELTEDKSKSWEERKRAGIAKVPHMSPQAATVKSADKLHNLQSLAASLRTCTDRAEVWKAFRRGPELTLALSHELVEALALRVEAKVARSLRAALKAALEADHDAERRGAAAAAK